MRLEHLLILAVGVLLLLLLWPKEKGEAPVEPISPSPRAEIEVEGESLRKWSTGLSLAPGLPALARDVHPRIVLAWAALTTAAYSAGSPELVAAARKTRPRITIAQAALSTSVLPRASGDLARETGEARPRILVEWAALTASLYPQGPPDHATNPGPRIEIQRAAQSTIIQDIAPAPKLTEKTGELAPRIILEAAPLGQGGQLGPPPELPGE